MRTSVERLRIWLLVGAGLLVLVLAGFLGVAWQRTHRILKNLPGRLGVSITRDFKGYTYSQSIKGKTVFTLHAVNGEAHKDGNDTLHGVNLILYGRNGDRADHISGNDFEYNEKTGAVRALGIVHLDMQAPTPAADAAKNSATTPKPASPRPSGASPEAGSNSRVIHITTSGLVYTPKENLAVTDQQVEFAFGGFTGHAMGAVYNSATGHVTLQSAVSISGLERGQPVLLIASHAELDRQTYLVDLTQARYSASGETAQADFAHIHLRPDGSAERIVGDQRVRLEQSGQGVVTAAHGDLTLDTASKPQVALLTGQVAFADDEPLRQARGDAREATLRFDPQGRLQHVLMTGAVHSTERLRSGAASATASSTPEAAKAPWSTRDLTADAVDLSLAPDAAGKPQLRETIATGAAHLTTVSAASSAKATRGVSTSDLAADRLVAEFVPSRSAVAHGQTELSTVHGVGHTRLRQSDSTGLDQTSTGDTLDATFHELAGKPSAATPQGSVQVELATALQQGHVDITRRLAAVAEAGKSAPRSNLQHATADRAAYDQSTDLLTLTGSVQVTDTQSTLWSDRVVFHRASGDSTAQGSVKVTYLQSASPGQTEPPNPIHVLAAHADFNHDANLATFYGSPDGSPARLWQSGAAGSQGGGSQVEAPVLLFDQEHKRLTAQGAGEGAPNAVHAVLISAPRQESAGSAHAASASAAHPDVVRITSRRMVYSDDLRQIEFTGGVRVLDAEGDLRAQQATAYLQPAAAPGASPTKAAPSTGLFGGSIDHLIATGQVDITQPFRRATGERLVYTARDQLFVLTGTPAAPPKVVDVQQGTATGVSLRFHQGDDSVVIAGPDGATAGQKPHTQTTLQPKAKP